MRTISVSIQGEAPGLLMHRFSEITEADLQDPVKSVNKSHPTPAEEFEMSAYRRRSDGAFVQPGEHIYQAMVKAAAQFQIQGQGKKTYKDDFKGSLLVEPRFIEHENQNAVQHQSPVRIQRARIVRTRAHLSEWSLSFELRLLDDNIPIDVIQAVVKLAGERIGIGDWRPRFGRWKVTHFELKEFSSVG
jgi:hypothetical protein